MHVGGDGWEGSTRAAWDGWLCASADPAGVFHSATKCAGVREGVGWRRFVVLVSGTLVYGKGDAVEGEAELAEAQAADLEGLPPILGTLPAPAGALKIFSPTRSEEAVVGSPGVLNNWAVPPFHCCGEKLRIGRHDIQT